MNGIYKLSRTEASHQRRPRHMGVVIEAEMFTPLRTACHTSSERL